MDLQHHRDLLLLVLRLQHRMLLLQQLLSRLDLRLLVHHRLLLHLSHKDLLCLVLLLVHHRLLLHLPHKDLLCLVLLLVHHRLLHLLQPLHMDLLLQLLFHRHLLLQDHLYTLLHPLLLRLRLFHHPSGMDQVGIRV